MVTLPAPAVAAAWKQMLEEPVSMENALDARGRPPLVQLVASVTSLAVTQTPVLNPVLATAAVLSGVVVLLNSAALTVSADRDENVVGAAVVHSRPMIGFSIACWKIALVEPNAMGQSSSSGPATEPVAVAARACTTTAGVSSGCCCSSCSLT